MKRIVVQHSRLNGTVAISGAKNSSLRLLVATMLTDETVFLHNIPDILDVRAQVKMMEKIGKTINISGKKLIVNEDKAKKEIIWDDQSIRNTLLMLGVLLARHGEGRVPLPGGCDLGERKYDLHEMAMRTLGAEVWEEAGEEDECEECKQE